MERPLFPWSILRWYPVDEVTDSLTLPPRLALTPAKLNATPPLMLQEKVLDSVTSITSLNVWVRLFTHLDTGAARSRRITVSSVAMSIRSTCVVVTLKSPLFVAFAELVEPGPPRRPGSAR